MKRLIIIIIMIAGLARTAGAQVVGIGQADMVTATGTIGVGDPPIELTVTGRTIATITLVSSAATTGSVEFHVQAGTGPWAPITGFDTLANAYGAVQMGVVPLSHTWSFNVSGVDRIRIQEQCCLSTIDGDTVWLLQAMVGSAPSQTGNAVTVTSGAVTVSTLTNTLNSRIYGQVFGVLEPEPGLAVNVADGTPHPASMGLVTRNIPSGVQAVTNDPGVIGGFEVKQGIGNGPSSLSPWAVTLTKGANDVAVLNAAPTTEYGLVVRNIPSGIQSTTMGTGNLTAWGGVTFGAAAALSDTYGNPTVPPVGAFLMGWDAGFARWERAQMVPATGYLGIYNTNQPALVAGSAIIGKVGIDQTTPGTTNGVQVNAALPAGANIIGNVRIDQTTPGTTNGVTIVGAAGNAALVTTGDSSLLTMLSYVPDSGGVPVRLTTGNGAATTGSPRVAVAKNNASALISNFAVDPVAKELTATAGWTTGTALNTDLIPGALVSLSSSHMLVSIIAPATITSGVVAFLCPDPSANYYAAFGADASAPTAAWTDRITFTGTVVAKSFMVPSSGYDGCKLRLTTVLGGSGTVTVTATNTNQALPAVMMNGRVTADLAAGTSLIGKVGIDQTTPGTTNGVQVNAALPTGSNIVGRVGIDQTTPGTTNRVDIGVFPDNEPIDVARFGGSAVVTGTGVSGAGIPRVTPAMDPVTGNAPTAASVGVASATALASNASRKAAFFINTSNATISCAESGQTAVLNSGITLVPGAVYNMVPPFVTTGAVNCIAGAAASNLSILEKQ